MFCCPLDSSVTYIDRDVVFEIVDSGVNENNENYIWRTKPNGKITIIKALTGDSSIQPIQTLKKNCSLWELMFKKK